MKAVYIREQRKIEENPTVYGDFEDPALKDGQVLVRVQASGVCHTDLHIVEGDVPVPRELFPLIPGHEIVGEVIESRNPRVKEGTRVGIGWFYDACGKCEYCVSGRENLCPSATVTGINHHGGYAELVSLNGDYVTPIPEGLPSEQAAPLFCAGITAYTAVKRVRPEPGKRVAVFGVGGLGHYAIQLIEATGAKAVAITSRHARLAQEAGASQVLEKPEGPYDAAIVFAPNSRAVAEAARSVKPGGTVVVPAIMDRIEIPFTSFTWEKDITSVASGFRKDARAVLGLAADGVLRSMVKQRRLSEAGTVLRELKEGKVEGRVVLKP
ncbi:zinc-dependent alcohol dehydrogenase [Thermogymnomonas acidicola]|uniref:Zinc-dependent alcohol dehydrogenase n=1 Tax=Thermogymnomonas acidicola TaxID=399579 RepID=A0AA37BQU6_9ARCH|nr:alcohol dehydrogenase catalytic domain-containing protein [Thermogymnomonas acidicola]GGM71733.1 zinc-dependent alcohol dehydrogenase [Thermogymnomonas acidicola]